MYPSRLLVVLLFSFLAVPLANNIALGRTWKDRSGKFQVEADLVEAREGQVKLRKEDGGIVLVPIEKLSQEDRQYLATADKKPSKPTTTHLAQADATLLQLLPVWRALFLVSDRSAEESWLTTWWLSKPTN